MKPIRQTLAACACLLLAAPAFAQARFVPSADGAEITDAKTALVWRRCSEGQSWSGGICAGAAATYTHEQALVQAQSQAGWRLPNAKELASIVDRSRVSPAIDGTAFPGTPSNWYWTSSPYVGGSANAWGVSFYDGYVNYYNRYYGSYVRLVR